MEREKNLPNCADSDSHEDILQRIAHESFLKNIHAFIESHYKNKSFSFPIFSSLLCESSTRKSAKEILRESCFKFDGTSKTKKFRNELNNLTGEIHKLQIDNTQLKESIIDEMNNITESQYTHLKSIIVLCKVCV